MKSRIGVVSGSSKKEGQSVSANPPPLELSTVNSNITPQRPTPHHVHHTTVHSIQSNSIPRENDPRSSIVNNRIPSNYPPPPLPPLQHNCSTTAAHKTPTMSTNTAASASTPAPTKTYNLRNPMPLSAAQESEVKQMFYKRVRSHCADEIKGVYLLLSYSISYLPRYPPSHWTQYKQRVLIE